MHVFNASFFFLQFWRFVLKSWRQVDAIMLQMDEPKVLTDAEAS